MLRKLTFLAVSAVIAFGTLSFDLQQESENPGDRLVGIWEPSNGRSRIKVDRELVINTMVEWYGSLSQTTLTVILERISTTLIQIYVMSL